MANVIDRRGNNKNRLAGSRSKFIQRNKENIREIIQKHLKQTSIKGINKDVPISIPKTKEVRSKYSTKKGRQVRVLPGNDVHNKGDTVSIPNDTRKKASAGSGDDFEDSFRFILTKDEFMDLLFEGMCLPNFLKKSNKLMMNTKFVSGGYIKEGIPARLAIKKTLENSFARRIASSKPRDQTRFIDDIDLRYRNLIPQQQPVSNAVIFMVMDVSGSMHETRKLLAKKFFLLFYLFLTKNYKEVEIRFIYHTTEAHEVDEHTFFYSAHSGGTMVSPAFKLLNEIIDKEYDINENNIYVAQASDGDNWQQDEDDLLAEIDKLIPKIQYFAYIEVDSSYPSDGVGAFYQEHYNSKEIATAYINEEYEIIEVLRELFKEST